MSTEADMASSKQAVATSSSEPSEVPKAGSTGDAPAANSAEKNVDEGFPPSTADASGQNNDERKRRVYVGNLAWTVSWQDLKDLMKSTGHEVTRADIMTTPDGRSKGCGIVEFATPEGAAEAVSTLNDVELNGRQIFVREDREDRGSGGSGGGQRHNQFHQRTNYQQRHRGGQSSHQTSSSNRGGGGPKNAGNTSSSDAQAQSRRVYVGNLSWDVTWQELKEHMRSAGEVVFAEIITEHNGRSKGCGIVHYATDAEAQQAISTLAHTELKGRTIFVREDREGTTGVASGNAGGGGRSQNQSGNNTSVYVWNLSYETSWQDLKDHMRKAGNVDQATILTDANDGSSIGCGVVVYQKPQDAQRAIRELQDSELNGRPLKMREDRGGRGGGRGGGRPGGRSGRFGGRGGGRYGGRGGDHDHPQQSGGGSGSGEAVPEGTQLFVSNLPFDANWRDLKEHFASAGEVHRAFIKVSEDGRSKGFGIVRFLKKEDAENAIATLNGVEFQGRTLDVRHDNKA